MSSGIFPLEAQKLLWSVSVYLFLLFEAPRLIYCLTSLLTIFGVTALKKFHHGRRYTQTLSVMYAAGSFRVIKRSTL